MSSGRERCSSSEGEGLSPQAVYRPSELRIFFFFSFHEHSTNASFPASLSSLVIMIDVSSSPEKHMRHQENTVPDGLIDKQEKREKPLLKIETQLKSVNSA